MTMVIEYSISNHYCKYDISSMSIISNKIYKRDKNISQNSSDAISL